MIAFNNNWHVLNFVNGRLQEVQCVLGFLVAQVAPEDPEKNK